MTADQDLWSELEEEMRRTMPEILDSFEKHYKLPKYTRHRDGTKTCVRCEAVVSHMPQHSLYHRALSFRVHAQTLMIFSLVDEMKNLRAELSSGERLTAEGGR